MKRKIRLFLLFGLLMILSVACQSANTARATDTPKGQINWWTSWLTQPVCRPPCWQNITPGVTTMKEAISILENTMETKITSQSQYGVDWEFNRDEGGTLTASQDGIVRMIWIGTVSDRKLFLKTIVASYDDPEYVKPYDCREGMCETALVYPDLGMFLSVFIENTGYNASQEDDPAPEIEILPNTIVRRVYFVEPGIESFLNILQLQESELLMDWKGYGEYP